MCMNERVIWDGIRHVMHVMSWDGIKCDRMRCDGMGCHVDVMPLNHVYEAMSP